jgi:single-strand DNA-binding protein
MSGFVRVSLIGNLGKDPEVRFTAGGTAVANIRVACTERAKGKSGEWEDRTEWVGVVLFGKTAENAGQYLSKGRQVYVEGRLQTREWADKEGNKRFSTEVVANQVLFLGGGKGEGGGGEQPRRNSGAMNNPPPTDDNPPPLSDADLPF